MTKGIKPFEDCKLTDINGQKYDLTCLGAFTDGSALYTLENPDWKFPELLERKACDSKMCWEHNSQLFLRLQRSDVGNTVPANGWEHAYADYTKYAYRGSVVISGQSISFGKVPHVALNNMYAFLAKQTKSNKK